MAKEAGGKGRTLWWTFGGLLAVNGVLAHSPLPLGAKFLLGILILPVLLAGVYRALPTGPLTFGMGEGKEPAFPIWAAGGILALGTFLRFQGLTSLSGFPTMDESWIGGLALNRALVWDGSPWVSPYHLPAGHFLGQAVWFRLFSPSFTSLWGFAAFLSTATLAAGYWAARQWFPPRFAFLTLSFAAGNYWLLWGGRLSVGTSDMMPLAECLALGCLGKVLGPGRGHGRIPWALILGATVSFCLWTALVGWIFGLVATLTLVWGTRRGERAWLLWLSYGVGLLPALPLIGPVLARGMGGYPGSLWFWKGTGFYDNHWQTPLSYISGLFWGARDWTFWGGILDPLSGTLVLLGGALLLKARREGGWAWLLAACGTFLLPGLLTNNYEPFRVVPLAPILIVLQTLGWVHLLKGIRKPLVRKVSWTLSFLLITGLSLYHLWGPYREAWGRQGPLSSRFKPIESWRAYDLLHDLARKEGPGFIFTDLQVRPDPALRIGVFPDNRLEHPSLSGARWAAVVVDTPALQVLTPPWSLARRTWLSEHIANPLGGKWLLFLPREGTASLGPWKKAQADLQEVGKIMLEGKGPGTSVEARDLLEGRKGDFRGDPFLEWLYGAKTQDLGAR